MRQREERLMKDRVDEGLNQVTDRGRRLMDSARAAAERAGDHATLKAALERALDDALKDSIAFTPTMVVITRAMISGDRVYLRLLIADAEGEQTVREMTEVDAAPPPPPRTDI